MYRDHTRAVRIGDRIIGHGNPILIQSMTNTRTSDVPATVAQIRRLEDAGCEIVRCTVPDRASAESLSEIKKQIRIPLVADIHFDYRLAVLAAENGADKIRINPGNIGSSENVRQVVDACKARRIPIRVGVNSGSLETQYIEKYGLVTAEGLVESALSKAALLEEMDFHDIVISIKSSNVLLSVRAYEMLAKQSDYPLHIGITEAGGLFEGNIKSAIGIGLMLDKGFGDTLRVSLTGDPVEEIRAAKTILRAMDLRKTGIEVVSCPTCGRTKIDLISLEKQVEEMVARYPDLTLKVAVMGCVVNGPGEAKEADVAICGGDGCGLLLKKGEIIRKVKEEELLSALENELAKFRQV